MKSNLINSVADGSFVQKFKVGSSKVTVKTAINYNCVTNKYELNVYKLGSANSLSVMKLMNKIRSLEDSILTKYFEG